MSKSSTTPHTEATLPNPVGRFMVAVGAVIQHTNTGKILLIKRSTMHDFRDGEWEIIYGRIDQHEDPDHGLLREVREETGITDLTIHDILTSWHIYRGERRVENDLIGITYACTTNSETVQLSHEHADYKWVTPEEALELVTVEGIKRDVRAFMKRSAPTVTVGRDVVGVGVGALIVNEHNQVLLSLRGPKAKNEVGKWEIPGGAVEFGETFEEALRREIKEEIGVDIAVGEMLQLCDHILPEEGQHWVAPTYFCTIQSGTPENLEPGKCDQLGWFSLEEAEKLPLSKITKEDVTVLRRHLATSEPTVQ